MLNSKVRNMRSKWETFARWWPGLVLSLGLLLPMPGLAATSTTSTVTAGDVRFQFLTPSLLRMEYAPSGHFIDAPTAVVVKRRWAPVRLHKKIAGSWLVVSTSALTLHYRLQSGAFTASNLQVTWRNDGKTETWYPGRVDRLNLGGLAYSLDNVSAANLPADGKDLASPVHDVIPGIDVLLPKAKPGLLSRSGFAFIDDSRTPVWNARKQWIEPRTATHDQDWYLFTYDRAGYREVLQEYAQLCGPIPMIPRYVLGPMITDLNFPYLPDAAVTHTSAFQHYDAQHLKDEVTRLQREHIPLSVLVLDFGWHAFGWQGGYDWSPLIEHPTRLLQWLDARGVRVALNDHPGYANTHESSLSHRDTHAPAVLRVLGKSLPPKPAFNLDLSHGWVFAPDPHNEGVRGQWFATHFDASGWRPFQPDASPTAQGYANLPHIVWYRNRVTLPAQLPPHLYLYLGRRASGYRLYVNGHEVEHSHVTWPRRLTWAGITAYAHPGQSLWIAVRMEANGYGNGYLSGVEAIHDVPPPKRIYLDLSNQQQAMVSMRELHDPLLRQGVAFWWVDGGSGAATMPGLNPQLWTNHVFYDSTQKTTGKRAFILSRYGGWGSERYPGYFTGDTYSEWPVLRYEIAYSTRAGNVLVPYVSHDIGGFHGGKIPFKLYARWVEFGAFSPLMRMHSAHENPEQGNLRMPRTYGERGIALVRKYFTLHEQLIPYVYTYAWLAHTKALPIMRPLYLQDAGSRQAYRHPHEYWYGDEMLVAPVFDATGKRTVYLPPGQWFDFFSGEAHQGGDSFTAIYDTDETPVFARNGAIIPERPASSAVVGSTAMPTLVVNAYGTGKGSFTLYADDGTSLAYTHHAYALTPMAYAPAHGNAHRLVIGPTRGNFAGQAQQRAYVVKIHGVPRPVALSVDGQRSKSWAWDATTRTARLRIPARSIRQQLTVQWRGR